MVGKGMCGYLAAQLSWPQGCAACCAAPLGLAAYLVQLVAQWPVAVLALVLDNAPYLLTS